MSAARFAEPVTNGGNFVDLADLTEDGFLVEILLTLDEEERATFGFGGMFLCFYFVYLIIGLYIDA
jgi:hypothetical protein